MDHIPFPQNRYPHLDTPIPYLSFGLTNPNLKYDAEKDDFDSFALKLRFPPEKLLQGCFGEWDCSEVFCFLQSWLFFALLITILREAGIELKVEDFLPKDVDLQNRTKACTITTSKLPHFAREWAYKARRMTEVERQKKYEKTKQYLLRANSILNGMGYHDFAEHGDASEQKFASKIKTSCPSIPGAQLHLSLVLLGEWLTVGMDFYRKPTATPNESGISWGSSSRLLRQRMLVAGWCETELYSISLSPSVRYYLSHLNRKTLNKNHEDCKDPGKEPIHLFCQFNQQDPNKYQPKHTRNCSETGRCWFEESADHSAILTIEDMVSDDKIPAITVQSTIDKKEAPTIVPACPGGKYVCISHVWAE
jgi:hypothetical protein